MEATRETGTVRVEKGAVSRYGYCTCCSKPYGHVFEITFGQLTFRACKSCLNRVITLSRTLS